MQQKIKDILIPVLAAITEGDRRQGMFLDRALVRGPDPLLLMEGCPEQFDELCVALGLSTEQGREAIEAAHAQGPACLLDPAGDLPYDFDAQSWETLSVMNRQEALWLILADVAGQALREGEDNSMLGRIQQAIQAGVLLDRLLRGQDDDDAFLDLAGRILRRLRDETEWEWDPDDPASIPTTRGEYGFYVGYKEGFSCVRVILPDGTAYVGTPPEHTLEEQGVLVDKQISPQFGIIFGGK